METKRRWPANMGFLSNKMFDDVFENYPEYVEFSRKHILRPTGTFKLWLEYLNLKK